jgi:hypothetical protein
VDWTVAEFESVSGFYECGNEIWASIKGNESICKLSDYFHHKKDSTP